MYRDGSGGRSGRRKKRVRAMTVDRRKGKKIELEAKEERCRWVIKRKQWDRARS